MSDQVVALAAVAAPVLPEDWEALDQCHRQVMTALGQLQQLCLRLEDHGVDDTSRTLAQQISDFFSHTARQHHADEERLVFPGLLQGTDAELAHHVHRLQQDHGWLEEDWLFLAPQMEAIAKGYSWYDLDALRAALPVFVELYLDHIDLEESLIYPEAKRRLSTRADAGRGRSQRTNRAAASPAA